jgi:hypothetical protein
MKTPTRGQVFQKIVLSASFIGDRCRSDRFVDHHDGLARCAALFPANVYATDLRGAHRREIKQQLRTSTRKGRQALEMDRLRQRRYGAQPLVTFVRIGSVNWNVEPTPSLLSTVTFPP